MHIATNPLRLPFSLERGSAITIGNFDGVHTGHQQLIRTTINKARELQVSSTVITFDPHPLRVIAKEKAPATLMTTPAKLQCLAALGVDLTLVLPFTKDRAEQEPEAFVEEVLMATLHVKHLTIGYDYVFGKNRRGTASLLKELGRTYGFTVQQIPPVITLGETVSSTRIRNCLLSGDIATATALLGRPHSVEGIVVKGMQRGGSLLGFPTANLQTADGALLPQSGIYAVQADIFSELPSQENTWSGTRETTRFGVANIGKNPTFDDTFVHLETHLIDFDGDIYDKYMRVHFIKRLRDEKKFPDVSALATQIQRDKDEAIDFFATYRNK